MAHDHNLTTPLVAELERHGVREWSVIRGSKRFKLRFPWQGGVLTLVYSHSPGDVRALSNCLSNLRRMMGVRR